MSTSPRGGKATQTTLRNGERNCLKPEVEKILNVVKIKGIHITYKGQKLSVKVDFLV